MGWHAEEWKFKADWLSSISVAISTIGTIYLSSVRGIGAGAVAPISIKARSSIVGCNHLW